MKASDYIARFIRDQGVRHVFTVSGAGDLHLLDSIRRQEGLDYVCNHHEQACGMAAYAYARVTRDLGVALVTTGPGGTNAITGVCSAWVDSIPCLILSGQVKYRDTIQAKGLPLRQMGVQEINIVDIVRPFTKYAALVTSAKDLRWHLEQAVHLARSGRPGPVWLDIPMDVQATPIDPAELRPFPLPAPLPASPLLAPQVAALVEMLRTAQRPVFLAGHGIKAAGAEAAFRALVDRLDVPVLLTWNAVDLLPSDHPRYVGRPGTYGQRGANFALQNSDLLLVVGSRLSLPQIGYDYTEFARAARKVYVDIDPAELAKFDPAPDLSICADAGEFLAALAHALPAGAPTGDIAAWRERCAGWRDRYPAALPEYRDQKNGVNSFTFIDLLSQELAEDELIVPGASGTAFTCTHQTLRIRAGQTCFTSNGFAEMGFDLPGAIGACVGAGGKRTILLTGDGSIQMNLQEMQTIRHHRLPIKIFYLNNQGYLTIRHTQTGLFKGEYSGSGQDSGVSFPDIQALGRVYDFTLFRVSTLAEARATIRAALDAPGPVICELVMEPMQLLVPKTSFKQLPDGSLVSPPLEDLFPLLPREEFRANMLIPTIKDDF